MGFNSGFKGLNTEEFILMTGADNKSVLSVCSISRVHSVITYVEASTLAIHLMTWPFVTKISSE